MSHRYVAITIVLFLFALLVMVAPASAHPPSDLVLSYDPGSGLLNATFTHMVQDPTSHYVIRVEIDATGGMRLMEKTYTSQPTNGTFTYSYPLQIPNGTQITVGGECNLGGEIHRSLVIGQVPTITTTITTQTTSTTIPATTKTPGFTTAVTIFALEMFILGIFRLRK